MAVKRTRRAKAARKRKRRMDRVEHDLTDGEWSSLRDAWVGCAYCGTTDQPLQRDCVLAISRGGRYTLANVVPACRSCNASKCNDEVTTWMRRKRLDERSFLVRHHEIRSALVPAVAVTSAAADEFGTRSPSTNGPSTQEVPPMTAASHDLPEGISNPARRALATVDVTNLEQLSAFTRKEIADLHGMGPKGVRILAAALAEVGVDFATE